MTPSITCPVCGRTSYHPKDIHHHYCSHCHAFHTDINDRPVPLEHMRQAIIRAAQQWEERNASVPENPMLRAFAAHYGISYDWLMGRKATPEV